MCSDSCAFKRAHAQGAEIQPLTARAQTTSTGARKPCGQGLVTFATAQAVLVVLTTIIWVLVGPP